MKIVIIGYISWNLQIAVSLAEKIYLKMLDTDKVDFNKLSAEEILNKAKEWQSYFTIEDRKQFELEHKEWKSNSGAVEATDIDEDDLPF